MFIFFPFTNDLITKSIMFRLWEVCQHFSSVVGCSYVRLCSLVSAVYCMQANIFSCITCRESRMVPQAKPTNPSRNIRSPPLVLFQHHADWGGCGAESAERAAVSWEREYLLISVQYHQVFYRRDLRLMNECLPRRGLEWHGLLVHYCLLPKILGRLAVSGRVMYNTSCTVYSTNPTHLVVP